MKPRPRLDRMEGHTFIGNWLGPGSVVLDCGMNRGVFAQRISGRYGCRVVGVEANPSLAESNRQERGLECHNMAVCGRSGRVRFQVNDADPLASTIVGDDAEGVGIVDVRATRLDELLSSLGDPSVDLLKLDIEGAELDVIGTTPLEVFSRIPQIAAEFHVFLDAGQRPSAVACIERLKAAGFVAFDFSMNLGNVLFVNHRTWRLSLADKAYFLAAKYYSGAVRTVTQTHQ